MNKKIKLIEAGYEHFTGLFGDVEFVDGVSVEDLSPRAAERIANIIRAETLEGANPSSSQTILESSATPMSESMLDNIVVNPDKIEKRVWTRDELTQIADEGGIEAIRKIAEPYGLKSRSIAQLVEQIVAVTATESTLQSLLGSSVQPSDFEFNGVKMSLGDVVRRAFEKTGKTVTEWNNQPAELREALIAEEVSALQGA